MFQLLVGLRSSLPRLRLSSACPFQTPFERALANLREWRSPQSLAWELNTN
jgi:hypothetical protein